MPTYNDPFSQFYSDVWAEIKKNEALGKLIPIGNFVDLSTEKAELFYNPRTPLSRLTTQPNLILLPESSDADATSDSSSSRFSFLYSWSIYTPHYLVSLSLYPILWQVFRSVRDVTKIAYNFEFQGSRYVYNVDTRFGEFNNPQLFANTSGLPELFAWRSTIEMSVDFSFPKDL